MRLVLKNTIRLSITVITLLYTACKDDDFLDGYNRKTLFSPPTQSELDEVRSDWSARDLSVKNYKVEQEITIEDIDATLKVISFVVSGHTEYSALLIPATTTKLPVHVYVGGFAIDNNVNSINLVVDNVNGLPFVFAFPALRGQSLNITINTTLYTSPISGGNHCEAFDGAADDVIAFLNVIEDTETVADVHRTTVRGGSRGATVSLLVAERDKRVKGAIGVAGPVELLTLTSRNENDRTYQCQFLDDLVNEKASLQSTRLKMIASSPLYFAESLPKTQLHLAEKDRIVPVSQGEELKAVMTSHGMEDFLKLFIYEGRSHENITTDNKQLSDRVNEFVMQF